jgi:hypothetical protein
LWESKAVEPEAFNFDEMADGKKKTRQIFFDESIRDQCHKNVNGENGIFPSTYACLPNMTHNEFHTWINRTMEAEYSGSWTEFSKKFTASSQLTKEQARYHLSPIDKAKSYYEKLKTIIANVEAASLPEDIRNSIVGDRASKTAEEARSIITQMSARIQLASFMAPGTTARSETWGAQLGSMVGGLGAWLFLKGDTSPRTSDDSDNQKKKSWGSAIKSFLSASGGFVGSLFGAAKNFIPAQWGKHILLSTGLGVRTFGMQDDPAVRDELEKLAQSLKFSFINVPQLLAGALSTTIEQIVLKMRANNISSYENGFITYYANDEIRQVRRNSKTKQYSILRFDLKINTIQDSIESLNKTQVEEELHQGEVISRPIGSRMRKGLHTYLVVDRLGDGTDPVNTEGTATLKDAKGEYIVYRNGEAPQRGTIMSTDEKFPMYDLVKTTARVLTPLVLFPYTGVVGTIPAFFAGSLTAVDMIRDGKRTITTRKSNDFIKSDIIRLLLRGLGVVRYVKMMISVPQWGQKLSDILFRALEKFRPQFFSFFPELTRERLYNIMYELATEDSIPVGDIENTIVFVKTKSDEIWVLNHGFVLKNASIDDTDAGAVLSADLIPYDVELKICKKGPVKWYYYDN